MDINRYAPKYNAPAIKSETVNPYDIATNIITVEPNTEAAPFTANPQSTNSFTRRLPFGNGIPIKNPSGAINRAESTMRPDIDIPPNT